LCLDEFGRHCFGGWDISRTTHTKLLCTPRFERKDLNGVKEELEAIKPMPAAFDHNWAKRLNGTHVKKAATRWEMVEQLRQDIRDFKAANNCERVVVLWAASTEIYIPLSDEHMSLAALEKAMKENNTDVISPSMCYAYAAIAEGAPFVMGLLTCVWILLLCGNSLNKRMYLSPVKTSRVVRH